MTHEAMNQCGIYSFVRLSDELSQIGVNWQGSWDTNDGGSKGKQLAHSKVAERDTLAGAGLALEENQVLDRRAKRVR
jgi:hypothetical protein